VTSLTRLLVRLAQAIESLSEQTGRLTAWLIPALVLLVAYDVAMRYLFQAGSVALQELEWHLFALIFLLGAAYTLRHDEHVRVDVIYRSRFMNDRRRALVDIIGATVFLLPFCLLIISSSWTFVHNAWQFGEGSPDPGGLPYRYLLKAAIPIGFGLLALQGIAGICRNLVTLLNAPARPRDSG
jgi:TRAP-type mannitol/chloroaromatic compound transport system permease small subunit